MLRYAFSCTVDLLDVRHLLRQYSNVVAQWPVSGLCCSAHHLKSRATCLPANNSTVQVPPVWRSADAAEVCWGVLWVLTA